MLFQETYSLFQIDNSVSFHRHLLSSIYYYLYLNFTDHFIFSLNRILYILRVCISKLSSYTRDNIIIIKLCHSSSFRTIGWVISWVIGCWVIRVVALLHDDAHSVDHHLVALEAFRLLINDEVQVAGHDLN